jgi:SAM-dependent methyltransferase
MNNDELKAKYDQMHKQGKKAWFDDGDLERNAILTIGDPWDEKCVLEIGCGEGDLCAMIAKYALNVVGVDYSAEAIAKAKNKYPALTFKHCDYRKFRDDMADVLVLQGVLEHLDKPFEELQWMIDHFEPKTVITSSPCFCNPRGLVWMTLDMLGGVMSKTDLHYLHPWDFERFCEGRYELNYVTTDYNWGEGDKMIKDLRQRIPLALRDGKIPYDEAKFTRFMDWFIYTQIDINHVRGQGAVAVYRIDL